jgi:hypothetical protein
LFLNCQLDRDADARKDFTRWDLEDNLVTEGNEEGGQRMESFVSGNRSFVFVAEHPSQFALAQARPTTMNAHVVRQWFIHLFNCQELFLTRDLSLRVTIAAGGSKGGRTGMACQVLVSWSIRVFHSWILCEECLLSRVEMLGKTTGRKYPAAKIPRLPQEVLPLKAYGTVYHYSLMHTQSSSQNGARPNADAQCSKVAQTPRDIERADLIPLFRLLAKQPPSDHDFNTCPICKRYGITGI